MPRDNGPGEVADLWAMAAELEQQFAGYKQRLALRNGGAHVDDAVVAACDDDASGGGGMEEEEEVESGGGDSGDVRGRMYGAYVRRRDERLRQGWLARMERKEAQVKAFWAQLELSGRASGNGGGERVPAGGVPTTTDAGTVAGDDEGKTERDNDDDDKKSRSADAALAPRRISGKKHARTRSFSSSTKPPDVVGRRQALSQEPPSPESHAAGGVISKENRARPAGGAAKATATSRPKASSRRKNSVKAHGGAKQTGLKLPRRTSSGGRQDLGEEVVLPSVDAAALVLSRSDEQDDVRGRTPEASPPRPSTSIGGGAGAANAQTAASPDSDRSEVVDAVPEGKPKLENAEAKKRGDEDVDACSPDKPSNPNGGITSDSDIESSYVYICKDIVEEHVKSLPQTLDASEAVPEISAKTNEDDIAETTTPPAGATATVIATTNAEEAPERESSGESSFSGRLWRSPLSSAAPSCSSRDQSIERVLEADAALLRKKRAEKNTLKTPGSAGSRVPGTAWSPKEKPRGFKKFLSFGKKNRAREVTVIDCTSPSVSSLAGDDDSGRWQSAGSIKPRMGFSGAASDDTDHGQTTSPRACSLQSLVAASPAKSELDEIVPRVKSRKAHRSFFSFLWLDCGRG